MSFDERQIFSIFERVPKLPLRNLCLVTEFSFSFFSRTLCLVLSTVFIMDEYFPDEDDNAAAGDAPPQVDASGAFAFKSDLAAPSGGFSFGGNNDSMNQ